MADLSPVVAQVHRWHLARCVDATAHRLLVWHGPELEHPDARPPAGDRVVCRDPQHILDEGDPPLWPCGVYRSVVTLSEHR